MSRAYVGRFAPSPTGRLHLGVARTSLAAWLDARAHGGRILLRIEDIDLKRRVPGAAEEIQRDMEWLGLDWDGEPVVQSRRFERYEAALDVLSGLGRVYACTCSRKEIAVASAPHGASDDGPRYPGTCRESRRQLPGRAAAMRLRTEPTDVVEHVDRLHGPARQNVFEAVGDFVLRRSDGLWAYQLAVTVDDLEQGVTDVVRGADLLASTPRQLLLRSLLEKSPPPLATLHLPLLLSEDGRRLSKRDKAIAIAEWREAGFSPEHVIGMLAASLGLVPAGESVRAAELVTRWSLRGLPTSDEILRGQELMAKR